MMGEGARRFGLRGRGKDREQPLMEDTGYTWKWWKAEVKPRRPWTDTVMCRVGKSLLNPGPMISAPLGV